MHYDARSVKKNPEELHFYFHLWNICCVQWLLWSWFSFHMNINPLPTGRFGWNFRWVTFKLYLVVDGWGISWEIALRWMSLDLTDEMSTLDQVMAWCRQAKSHYPSQSWPRSKSPNGVTRPQWVKWAAKVLMMNQVNLFFTVNFCQNEIYNYISKFIPSKYMTYHQ